MQYDVENVFFKFDEDCSGTLECDELHQMFVENNIEVSFDQIKAIFDIVDTKKTGKLDLTKFKELVKNEEVKRMFNHIIQGVRKHNRQH